MEIVCLFLTIGHCEILHLDTIRVINDLMAKNLLF